MTAPQNNPRIKFGLSAAKPLASTVPQGMIYVYTDALLLGVVAVNGPTGWVETTVNLSDPALYGLVGSIANVAFAPSAGLLDLIARADHAHKHGAQPLGAGTDHAAVTPTPGFNGFMTAADKLRLNRTQGGSGVTLVGTGEAHIVPPTPFDPLGGINVTKSGLPAATASVALQIITVDPAGAFFDVRSVDAAGVFVGEAVTFLWSTTPV